MLSLQSPSNLPLCACVTMLEETTPPTFPIENEISASAFLMDSNLRVVVLIRFKNITLCLESFRAMPYEYKYFCRYHVAFNGPPVT